VVGARIPPTTVTTIAQVYACLLAHYPTGSTLDDRVLLHGAMAALATDLARHGWDQSAAVLPPLHGTPAADWRAFRQTYAIIAAGLPRDGRIRAGVAQAAINGMTASLHDDHTRYAPPLPDTGGNPPGAAGQGDFGLGLRLSADSALPDRTIPPMFIIGIDPGSPADRAGLRLGDVITAINGLPPVVAGVADQAVLAQLDGPATARLMARRPANGRVMTVSVTPAPYPVPQPVLARILPGHLAYVRLTSFVDNTANFVVAAVDGLGLGRHLHGVVLDLRGNEGGSAAEPPRLLGAFAHHKIVAYYEDGRGHRTAIWTDDAMPVLGVPLVVLIDRGCASACDVTAAAVRDLHLGRLVGERTAGDVAGPAEPWFLGDGGVLQIPVAFMRGAKGEIVDGIGVPPDEEVAASPAALSAGRDLVLDRALADLGG
jgi:carboxyl-terminal processing protease